MLFLMNCINTKLHSVSAITLSTVLVNMEEIAKAPAGGRATMSPLLNCVTLQSCA